MRQKVTPEEIEHTKKALAEFRLSKKKSKEEEETPEPQPEPA
jgi:hypothetical protein